VVSGTRRTDCGLTDKANSVADSINAVGPGRALAVVGDVLDAQYMDELVKKAAEFGGGRFTLLSIMRDLLGMGSFIR
jgi:hypothetical protein